MLDGMNAIRWLMNLKFRHKVFLGFLLNSLAIIVCMFLIGRHFSVRNFEEYVGKVEMEKLDELALTLSQEYQRNGNWDFVRENPGHWLQLKWFGPGHPRHIEEAPVFPPPPPPPDGQEPPPPMPGVPPPHGPPPGPRLAHRPPFISLFDAEKHPITRTDSPSTEGLRLKPVLLNNKPVAWLGIRMFQRPMHPLDVEFIRAQSKTFYVVGGVALLLAVILTFVLSRHILAPVRKLAAGTHALTSRRFETRVEIGTPDEFGQLAADFNSMAQSLGRYEQMRRQWIADISHELRTPLAILRGEIEAMQDGVREVTPEALESLHFEVLHVGRIVHDLHELSLIESSDFELEKTPVNPVHILEETLRSFQIRCEQRGLRVEVKGTGGECVLPADEFRLKQLYSNLLENTLRYAAAPGLLVISHSFPAGLFRIDFEDSGPGVPEESLDRLFDRLYRVDKSRSRSQGGSGLGLAICKSIVECFGGKIEASNSPAGGLRISIELPIPKS